MEWTKKMDDDLLQIHNNGWCADLIAAMFQNEGHSEVTKVEVERRLQELSKTVDIDAID